MFGRMFAAEPAPAPASREASTAQAKTDLFFAHIRKVFEGSFAELEQALSEQGKTRARVALQFEEELRGALLLAAQQQEEALDEAVRSGEELIRRLKRGAVEIEDGVDRVPRKTRPASNPPTRVPALLRAIAEEEEQLRGVQKKLAALQTLLAQPYVQRRSTAFFPFLKKF